MARFSACFLLVFGQLAVGGVAALAVPPFGAIERGFFKSSAAVFLAAAVVYVAGRSVLAARAVSPWAPAELVLWVGFVAALATYLASLWGDAVRLRARAFASALGLGVLALADSATAYRVGPLASPATVFYPLAFLTGALALGAVATGMLLGHWYLIDVGLSLAPMRRLFRYFIGALVLHVVVLMLTIVAMAAGPVDASAAVRVLWQDNAGLVALRFLLGPLAALALGWMIHRTLQIPQTMAATGLFYIAILFVLVGELLGRLILFRTSLPL